MKNIQWIIKSNILSSAMDKSWNETIFSCNLWRELVSEADHLIKQINEI